MKIDNTKASFDKIGKLLRTQMLFMMYRDDTWATSRTAGTIDHKTFRNGVNIIGSDVVFQIDEGRKPGSRPPTRAIEQWIKARNIKPMYKGGIKNMARMIANSIAEKGTIARFGYGGTDLLNRLIEDNTNEVEEIVLDGFVADIQAYFDKLPDQITI